MLLFAFSIAAQAYNVVGLSNIEKSQTYQQGMFTDVAATDWFSENVASVYSYGLMSGIGNEQFSPYGTTSIAEAITMASRIHCLYFIGDAFNAIPEEDPYQNWYDPYVEYALEMGIIENSFANYTTIATRAQFARILAASIDDVDLQPINLVEDGAIPDVDMNADYADAVYLLYRAGVLSGSDAEGTFNPDSTISRAEVAAIVTRMVEPTLRKTIELSGEY